MRVQGKKIQRQAKMLWRLGSAFLYDFRRFVSHADHERSFRSQGQLESYILMLTHSLEKGLALPVTRQGFGVEKIRLLLRAVEDYLGRETPKDWVITYLREVCTAYEGHLEYEDSRPDCLQDLKDLLDHRLVDAVRKQKASSARRGGTRNYRSTIGVREQCIARTFLRSRASVRKFREEPVADEIIQRAVETAMHCPSVCNRQSGRVRVYRRHSKHAKEILRWQQGNKGFGEDAARIILVSADLNCFLSTGERNQCWIDGGLFAMMLLLALESEGVSTCCLNWSATIEQDKGLRRSIGFPVHENIVMAVAVGYAVENCSVAASVRRPVENVLQFVE